MTTSGCCMRWAPFWLVIVGPNKPLNGQCCFNTASYWSGCGEGSASSHSQGDPPQECGRLRTSRTGHDTFFSLVNALITRLLLVISLNTKYSVFRWLRLTSSRLITICYCPALLFTTQVNTGLWLVKPCHVTWILSSNWSTLFRRGELWEAQGYSHPRRHGSLELASCGAVL